MTFPGAINSGCRSRLVPSSLFSVLDPEARGRRTRRTSHLVPYVSCDGLVSGRSSGRLELTREMGPSRRRLNYTMQSGNCQA